MEKVGNPKCGLMSTEQISIRSFAVLEKCKKKKLTLWLLWSWHTINQGPEEQ